MLSSQTDKTMGCINFMIVMCSFEEGGGLKLNGYLFLYIVHLNFLLTDSFLNVSFISVVLQLFDKFRC